ELFAEYIRTIGPDELAVVEPLPFRRTLSPGETMVLGRALTRRWSMPEQYWYPLDPADQALAPPHTIALDAAPFDEDLEDRLRQVLVEVAAPRLYHLGENSEEVDVELFDVRGSLGEEYWTDASMAWVVYDSHESSVTVAGVQL